MKKSVPKSKAREEIEEFFSDIKNKSPKEVKKIKRLAMQYNVPLKEKRKLFCKKCYSPYVKPKVRIKDKIKTVVCKECNHFSRWKI